MWVNGISNRWSVCILRLSHSPYNSSILLPSQGMLEAEEGDRPMGEVPVSASGRAPGSQSFSMVWKWLQAWVYTAAAKAPSRTGRPGGLCK